MALRSDLSDQACTIARGVDILGDPWVILVLRELFQSHGRFDELVLRTGGAESVISRRLALLVRRGLVVKIPYRSASRTRLEYQLTESGRDTLPVLHALSNWGAKHTSDDRHIQIECLRCGTTPPSSDWCPTCNAPLTSETTGWRKPNSPDILTALAGPAGE